MASSTVAIAGAGIGGLTAALALADAGCDVTLLERRTGFNEIGAGIQLSPNASRVLIGLGLGSALQRAATEPGRVAIQGLHSGLPIGEVALGAFMRERFGAPYYVIHRADLQTILLDAVRSRSNIRLFVGRSVTGAESGADGVALAVEKSGGGVETFRADVALGADGLWSTLRRSIGDDRQPVYRGYAAWRATVAREAAPAELAGNETGLWLGRRGHVVHYPISGGRRINIVAFQRRAEPLDDWATPGDATALLESFGRIAAPLRTLLERPAEWHLWSLFDLPAKRMARGRVALLGDSAHPVLPFLAQGGALAIEDAAALATALADASRVETALKRYGKNRLRRVRRVQTSARRNASTFHAGALVSFARDVIIGRLGPVGMAERYAWIYGWKPPAV